MKTEVQDIAYELAVRTAPSTGAAWWADWWDKFSWSAFFSLAFIILQIAYLLRKWWREETEWGIAMKKLFGVEVQHEPTTQEDSTTPG